MTSRCYIMRYVRPHTSPSTQPTVPIFLFSKIFFFKNYHWGTPPPSPAHGPARPYPRNVVHDKTT